MPQSGAGPVCAGTVNAGEVNIKGVRCGGPPPSIWGTGGCLVRLNTGSPRRTDSVLKDGVSPTLSLADTVSLSVHTKQYAEPPHVWECSCS